MLQYVFIYESPCLCLDRLLEGFVRLSKWESIRPTKDLYDIPKFLLLVGDREPLSYCFQTLSGTYYYIIRASLKVWSAAIPPFFWRGEHLFYRLWRCLYALPKLWPWHEGRDETHRVTGTVKHSLKDITASIYCQEHRQM